MKFGKEYEAQMVPEWQEAYMDYSFLKTLLKEIQKFQKKTKARHHNHHHHHHHQETAASALKRKLTLYRTFSGLTKGNDEYQAVSPNQDDDLENQAIRVGPVLGGDDSAGCYRTTFLMPSLEGGEYELVYFRRLDDEFNKVNKFYKEKVVEVMKEAGLLSQQMNALIAFRVKVENPIGWRQPERSVDMTRLASDIAASAAALAASTPSGAKSTNRRGQGLNAIDEGSTRYGRPDESMEEKAEEAGAEEEEEEEQASNETVLGGNQNAGKESEEKPLRSKNVGPAPLQILKNVKINNTPETPRSTLKTILKVPNQTNLKFTRENLRKVEDQLKRAFVAFYQKLRLLKSFSFLNTLAFSKIMKKYDKITSRNASKPYMAMIDSSCLGSSDEVTKLIERVEATFIKHFSNSNRTKGMSILRPKAKKERHRTTFSTGFFAGTTIALLIGLILIFRARKLMHEPGRMVYMETMFPLYSLFGFIVLHLLMYAVNIYFWRRYRVNYSFIFGFKPGTEPSYRQVSLLGFGIATLALCCVLLNLDMEMDPETKDYKALTELLPLNLLLVLFILLFLPFNILYRPGRFFFLSCLFRCIASPLYKVTLPDFFLADQLTSQVQALRSLEFYICYYVWGDYKKRLNTCPDNSVYITFSFIVAVVPYWSRLLQCLRRLFEEKDPNQAQNGLKYFLTIVAVSMRTAYKHNKESEVWRAMAWTSSAIAAIVSTHWDLVHDWGLLQRGSKNAWLRDKLLIPCNNVYYVGMVLNVLLRFAWLQTVLNFNLGSLHNQTIVAIVASLEIFRRGMWNFFRLENEHLNNVGKYRAFKSVPLPFNYDEDDDKDE